MNELIKFWLPKEKVSENMDFIKKQLWTIDSFTLYEFLSGTITEEEYNNSVVNYLPKRNKPSRWTYWFDEMWTGVNPNKQCVYKKPGVWERCVYCNQIKKYMIWKECPRFKWEDTPVNTDTENK